MTHDDRWIGGDPRASAFDARARALHRQAAGSLSERTRIALQRARHAAATPASGHRESMHRWYWPVAAGSFAVALAAVLLVQLPGATDPSTATAPAVAAEDAANPAETLDENPDLYLWLASNDAVAFASE